MRTAFALVAALVLASCGSVHSNNANGAVADPEVVLEQTSRVPGVAEYTTGAMPVSFHMGVTNRANVPIVLKRVEIQSVGGTGGFEIQNTSRSFELSIAPGANEGVDFWAPAVNTGMNVTGANEPVTVRVTAVFDSSLGSLQNVTMQQVSAIR